MQLKSCDVGASWQRKQSSDRAEMMALFVKRYASAVELVQASSVAS